MKNFCLFAIFLSIVLSPYIGQGAGQSILTPADNTKKWKYPYEVDALRANELHDGMMKLADYLTKRSTALNSSDAISIFGVPDMITDLDGAFTGLSSKEDGYLAQHKSELKWRLVWYLKKKNKLPDTGDIWIGVYINKSSDQIIYFILN